jgi:hypothetical protein
MGETISTHTVLNGKTEGKGPFEKPRLRCEANIKMDLYTELEAADWIHLAQNRDKRWAVVSTVKK